MKKLLATMLVGVVGITAIAQTVVYDYKATFKRLNPVYKLRTLDPITLNREGQTPDTYGKGKYVTESYQVKSDTIYGYVVLPLCESCDGSMESSLDYTVADAADSPFAYLARKGDTMTKKEFPGDLIVNPYVAKVAVAAKSAIFKSTVYDVPMTREATPQVQLPKTMDAWMTLDFAIPSTPYYTINGVPQDLDGDGAYEKLSLDPGHVIASAASTEPINLLRYGFLGLDSNEGNKEMAVKSVPGNTNGFGEGYVVNKGFGKATVITSSTPGTIGVCAGDEGSFYSCNIISSISGSVGGEFGYVGACGVSPIWDICDVGPNGVNAAPIAGTWTLKYNKSMTNKGTTAQQESAIQSKLGWDSATKLIDLTPVYEE